MASETNPSADRELARRVAETGARCRVIPGTKGNVQRLTERELDYLRWLYAKEKARDGGA